MERLRHGKGFTRHDPSQKRSCGSDMGSTDAESASTAITAPGFISGTARQLAAAATAQSLAQWLLISTVFHGTLFHSQQESILKTAKAGSIPD